jgi:hypothetical protein
VVDTLWDGDAKDRVGVIMPHGTMSNVHIIVDGR